MASIGDYKVIRQIGSGGFADVYLVEKDGKVYAAKGISLSQRRKKSNIQTIKKEIKHLQRAKHTNIAYLKDLIAINQNKEANKTDILAKADLLGYNSRKKIYLIQEYAEKSLYELIFHENVVFMEYKARSIICQILSAVSHLHDNNICHRDIKLQNIMLNTISNPLNKDKHYIVKLIDLGLSTSTKSTTFRGGSKEFLAPELVASISAQSSSSNLFPSSLMSTSEEDRSKFENDDKSDDKTFDRSVLFDGAKCDAFSLGVTFYIMLTGKSPWRQNINALEGKVRYPAYLSKSCVNFLSNLLEIDPTKRISASDALKHPWLAHDAGRYTRNSFCEPKDNNERLSFNMMNKFLFKELGCKVEAMQKIIYDPVTLTNSNISVNENEDLNASEKAGKIKEEKNEIAPIAETNVEKKYISGFDSKVDDIFKKIALLRNAQK